MKHIAVFVGLTSGLLTSTVGCYAETTAYSMRINSENPNEVEGLAYFLPKRLVKVVMSRTPLDLAKVTKDHAAKQATWTAAKSELEAASKAKEDADSLLAEIAPDDSAFADARNDAKVATAKEQIAKANELKAHQEADTASANLAAVVSGGATCSYSAAVELQAAQADETQHFLLRPEHSVFRDDVLKVAAAPTGLLSSTNAVAIDRTGDVIVELAGLTGALQGGGKVGLTKATDDTPSSCATLPKQFISFFDPTNAESLKNMNDDLANAQFPFHFDDPGLRRPAEIDDGAALKQGEQAKSKPKWDGIVYRTPLTATLTLRQCTAPSADFKSCPAGKLMPVAASLVSLPQAGPVSYIPMRSGRFVKTVTDVQFVDGIVTKWDTDQPSQAIALVSITLKALKALVSVPAELISLKVDYSSKSKSLADAQIAQMESEKKMLKLKLCIDAVAASDTTGDEARKCFSNL